MNREIVDIKGAHHIFHDYGERFRGWYFFKNFLRKETVNIGENSYPFKVCEYNYQFIMPSKIEFLNGIISYSEAERKLGVFRFPRDEKGEFCTPLSMAELRDKLMNLTKEEINNLLKKRSVLTFEAFRIPQFGFEFFNIEPQDFKDVTSVFGPETAKEIKSHYDKELEQKIDEVKNKIISTPNYLLILENVLNKNWKNLQEVVFATNNIIHI